MRSSARSTVAAGLLALAASAATTQETAPVPAGGALTDRIVNDPRPDAFNPYGFPIPPRVIRDKAVQFGKAMRVSIPRAEPGGGQQGLTLPLLKPVGEGEKLVIAFWARAHRTEGGAQGKITRVRLEESTPPHRDLFGQPVVVGPEWRMHQVSGVVDRAYPAGKLGVAMHLAAADQVLDNRYQGSLVADEPRGRWTYYRFHVPDPIFFRRELRVDLQQIGSAPKARVVELLDKGVKLTPVTIDPGQRSGFAQLLSSGKKVTDPGLPTGHTNFYRSDDVSAVAYFYLDRPASDLPALMPASERLKALRPPPPPEKKAAEPGNPG